GASAFELAVVIVGAFVNARPRWIFWRDCAVAFGRRPSLSAATRRFGHGRDCCRLRLRPPRSRDEANADIIQGRFRTHMLQPICRLVHNETMPLMRRKHLKLT